ncbi:uncharacterized protein F5891DRAFT_974202 [Suillus fuscotomentosus]|uniref:Uncharacterized protein n=1 Tax=Suillus fuscotomentosus TaxID=1912939 RepID=A0AAD4EMH7_9AGAM|nr:uncharacterized protein F5891DRAFT_974202 [Suillus fuscotomentosus]KAG1908917.1 hypothetical protein F5891DRAFT_974202 [Suillus fuscotomentosus]
MAVGWDKLEVYCHTSNVSAHTCVADTCTSPPSVHCNSKAPSKSASKNTHNGSFALRACYIMHGMLVMIHIVFVIFYICQSKDYATFSSTSTNSDFWSAMLSASLQAFYTIYTGVLLFLTQRLAISRTLSFTTIVNASVPTTLGWPDDSSYGNFTNLGPIVASLPVISQLTGLASTGLANTTLYDTLTLFSDSLTPYDTPLIGSEAGIVVVNATTVTSSCGLIPNVTYSANTSTAIFPFGQDSLVFNTSIPRLCWARPDTYNSMDYEDSDGDSEDSELDGIYIMVSTLSGIDPSVQDEVAVNTTWAIPDIVTPYVIQVYFIYCSLSVITIDEKIGAQTNSPPSPTSTVSQPYMQWEMYSDYQLKFGQSNTSSWKTQISKALATNYSSGMVFEGLNLAAEYTQFRAHGALPILNFTLGPNELEFAVPRTAAQLIWLAGQLGAANGGIDPGNGLAYADIDVPKYILQLNINLLPLAFAAAASVIMLGLALHMTRAFDTSHDRQARAAIPNIGVQQLLWLGHRSTSVNEVLEDVQHPTEANLRRAGMIDVCFSHIIPDEGEVESSTAIDSLSCNVGHRRDDKE